MKRDNTLKGVHGEKIAENYLIGKGYRVLNKNFKTEVGEIDLIVTDENTLVFVEVKTRMDGEFGNPAEAVDFRKQKKICMVASQYIKKFRLYDTQVRFDVVEVYIEDSVVNHIEGAFESCLNF